MTEEPSPSSTKRAEGELPGVLRVTWLLFMQPIKLLGMLEDWGIDPGGNVIIWWRQGASGRGLLLRLATILLVGTPLLAFGGANQLPPVSHSAGL